MAEVALSLRQPWAWMVVHGGKTIENRRWNTRRRGPILIHAAKGMTRDEYEGAVDFARDVNPALIVPPRVELLFGGIVGRARIVDVLPPCSLAFEDDCPHARVAYAGAVRLRARGRRAAPVPTASR